MKFKMQVKVNFTVAERCHYHHATRAHQQQSRHVLACKMAEWRQFANKQRQKRAAKGKRPARESV